jgi:hypothetical protein
MLVSCLRYIASPPLAQLALLDPNVAPAPVITPVVPILRHIFGGLVHPEPVSNAGMPALLEPSTPLTVRKACKGTPPTFGYGGHAAIARASKLKS